ncbi:MAG: FG-GAP-like repeat-containing protein, partial [Terriglobia bacterium]
FNADGKLDIIVGNGAPDLLTGSTNSDEMTVLYGNGDGTFVDAPFYLTAKHTTSVVAADFEGDGKPDLAAGSDFGLQVSLFKGLGGSNFRPLPSYNLNLGSASTAMTAGDFNADGKLDLAIAAYSGVSIALSNGDGTFQAPLQFPAGTNLVAIQTADFNGDGKADIVAADEPQVPSAGLGSVFIFLGNGDGTLRAATSVPAGSHPDAIAIGDFNGDSKPDLAVADSGFPPSDNGGLSILLGNGNGTFKSPVSYTAGINPLFVATGDLNGDGKLDLIVSTGGANYTWQLAVFLGKGDGTFQAPVYYPTDFGPQSLVIKDFNHDGKADVIVAHCCGAVDMTYLVGNGDGTLQPEQHFQGGPSPYALALADFNHDGLPDLAVANNDGGMTILLNASPAPAAFASVNAASSVPGPVASDSIVSAYGSGLATSAVGAVGALPTSLGGTTVTVKDAGGTSRPAQLFYVSPRQVNFTIPDGTMIGAAAVTIKAGDGTSQSAPVQIAPVAPGFFSYAGTGGLAAAQITRVHGDGSRDNENVYQTESGGKLAPLPINLGPSTDQVYLILYGTGIRGRSALSNVSVTIGGANAQVLYAGPQGA